MDGLIGDRNHLQLDGLNLMGKLEWPVMEFLWAHGTVDVQTIYMDLRAKLRPEGDREMAYTTFLNTVRQLVVKGLVTQKQSPDTNMRVYVYTAVYDRETYIRTVVMKVLDAMTAVAPELVGEYCRAHA